MILRYLPAALLSIVLDLARAHGRRLSQHVARAALWLVLLAPFTVAAPQASTYDLERRVAALEHQYELLRDRVSAQDTRYAALYAALEARTTSNTEKTDLVSGVFWGIGAVLVTALFWRILGKKNGNGDGNGKIL